MPPKTVLVDKRKPQFPQWPYAPAVKIWAQQFGLYLKSIMKGSFATDPDLDIYTEERANALRTYLKSIEDEDDVIESFIQQMQQVCTSTTG